MSGSYISKSHDSLDRSAALLSSLSFDHSPKFSYFALSPEAYFETHLIRDAESFELGLFTSSSSAKNRLDAVQEPDRAGGEESWKATKREGPKRVIGGGVGMASPLKERRNKDGGEDDPERCLMAAQKLLGVYPLPRASEHVSGLFSQLSGLHRTISSLEAESKRPLAKGSNVNNEAIRAAELEEELKKEQMEVFALEQMLEEGKAKAARKRPSIGTTTTRTRTPITATSKTATTKPKVATTNPFGKSTLLDRAARPSPTSSPEKLATPPRKRVSSLPATPSSASPRTPRTPKSSTESTGTPTPKKASSLQRRSMGDLTSPGSSPRKSPATAAVNGLTAKKSAGTLRRKSSLPGGVTEEDLEVIAGKIWNGVGDTLRPWARKMLLGEGKEVPSPLEGLGFADTMATLRIILASPTSSSGPTEPSSPTSTFNTLTSEQEDVLQEPLALPPTLIIECQLLFLMLSTLSGHPPPSTSLPPLTITLRDSVLPSSLTPLPSVLTPNKKDPMISMNALKVHLGAFSKEKGWAEEGATTAVYGLVSKTVVRIDRRGTGGPMLGFR